MIESQQVLEWIAMGEARGEIKGKANSLLRVLASRFPPGAPPEIAAAILATQDVGRLESWLDPALIASSLEDFRQTAGL